MYDFIEELKLLMKKHNIKSITPMFDTTYLGFKEDGKFYAIGNKIEGLTGNLKEKVNCEHQNKVYSNFTYASNPPQTPWICMDCGFKGVNRGKQESDNYEFFIRKFENQ